MKASTHRCMQTQRTMRKRFWFRIWYDLAQAEDHEEEVLVLRK
jgi:hypothetical protein